MSNKEHYLETMNKLTKNKLINILESKIFKKDPSHDINHTLRVLVLAEKMGKKEKADMDIVIPAAIFHDIINYPKNHIKRLNSSEESAKLAKKVLENIDSFPKNKINKVYESIRLCSFTKNIRPSFLEAKILQDADGIEAMGAISIMRTFSSAGILNRSFYNNADPFCKKRIPEDDKYAIDLFFTRLLIVKDRLHTKTAKKMARERFNFLKKFLKELSFELKQSHE
jgi:uncharacterized protein